MTIIADASEIHRIRRRCASSHGQVLPIVFDKLLFFPGKTVHPLLRSPFQPLKTPLAALCGWLGIGCTLPPRALPDGEAEHYPHSIVL